MYFRSSLANSFLYGHIVQHFEAVSKRKGEAAASVQFSFTFSRRRALIRSLVIFCTTGDANNDTSQGVLRLLWSLRFIRRSFLRNTSVWRTFETIWIRFFCGNCMWFSNQIIITSPESPNYEHYTNDTVSWTTLSENWQTRKHRLGTNPLRFSSPLLLALNVLLVHFV